jgi:hypothetical protein
MRILVSLLLFVGILDGALAFAPCRPTTARSSVVQRHMARFPQDNDGISNEFIKIMALDPPPKSLTPIQVAFWHLSSLASYLIMSFGAAVSFGFILNMVGLSYQFSWDHGVEVETIGKMREMNQFRAEVNHRPPSMLPK